MPRRHHPALQTALCCGLLAIQAFTLPLNGWANHDSPVLLASAITPGLPATQPLLDSLFSVPTDAAKTDPAPSQQPFKLNIQHTQQANADNGGMVLNPDKASVVLDTITRMIGGTQDDHNAATQRPAQKYVFEMPKVKGNKPVWLTINQLSGIHTPQAHTLGQTTDNHISSPLAVKVNGKTVQYISLNGDNFHIRIPKSVLRKDGFNTLQLQAGFYFTEDSSLAYDRIEFKGVQLDPA